MTPAKLKRLSEAKLRRIASEHLNIMVPLDYTKHDIADEIIDRLGEDQVAWTLLGQLEDQS